MKKKQIKTLSDFKQLSLFLAVNAHNLLVDSHIPGEKAQVAADFMKKCKEIVNQLEKDNE